MAWGKLDDRLHDNPKIRRTWMADRASLGLYIMSVSYANCNETDGNVDVSFVKEKLPRGAERARATEALVDAGLWVERESGGWEIANFLEFNLSRAKRGEGRRKDSERKARGIRTESGRNPDGIRTDSEPRGRGRAPDPNPNPSPNPSPNGIKKAGVPEPDGFGDWLAYHADRSGRSVPREGTAARKAHADSFASLLREGFTLEDFRLATDGVVSNEWRREHGHDKVESVLRRTKFGELVDDGRRSHEGWAGPQDNGSLLRQIIETSEQRERGEQ